VQSKALSPQSTVTVGFVTMQDKIPLNSSSFVRPSRSVQIVTVSAQPQPVDIDLARTALIVVDMQNDFLHPDGWFPRGGLDPSSLRKIIPTIAGLIRNARRAGLPIVWLNWGVRHDAANIPGFVMQKATLTGRRPGYGDPSPSGRGNILVRGDWGAANVDELTPEPPDIIVHKHRLTGFHDNELDSLLRHRGIDTLLFTGINTDRCVFSTLTDASVRGYGCILVEDACATPSPDFVRDAVLYLIHLLHGFSASSDAVIAATTSETSDRHSSRQDT
jgi:ureidoacrylate peracid hydrolase